MPGLEEVDEDKDSEDKDSDTKDEGEGPAESAGVQLSGFSWQSLSKRLVDNILERLSRDWNASIYVFFKSIPSIKYIKDRHVHVFECTAKHCKGKGNGRMVRRYLDTTDAKSTSNLRKHAKFCWGDEAVAVADQMWDVLAAWKALKKMVKKDGSILEAFEWVAKSKVTNSHCQHTTMETQCIFIPQVLGLGLI